MPTSPDPRLRLIRRAPLPLPSPTRVLGRGSLFQNQKVLGDAGAAIRRAVVQELWPGLPQRAAVAKYDEEQRAAQVKALQDQAGIKPEDDSATRLRKLFQPRTQQPRPEGTAASPKP